MVEGQTLQWRQKKDKRTNNDIQKTMQRTPLKTGGELRFFKSNEMKSVFICNDTMNNYFFHLKI